MALMTAGAVYFGGTSTDFVKSNAAGTELDIAGFADVDINSGNLKGCGDITSTGTITQTGSTLLQGAVTINESGADVDFRVEGDTDAQLLVCDASTDRVGVGVLAPAFKFHVEGAGATGGQVVVDSTAGLGDAENTELQIRDNGTVKALFCLFRRK